MRLNNATAHTDININITIFKKLVPTLPPKAT